MLHLRSWSTFLQNSREHLRTTTNIHIINKPTISHFNNNLLRVAQNPCLVSRSHHLELLTAVLRTRNLKDRSTAARLVNKFEDTADNFVVRFWSLPDKLAPINSFLLKASSYTSNKHNLALCHHDCTFRQRLQLIICD